jgi:hypothetical protein
MFEKVLCRLFWVSYVTILKLKKYIMRIPSGINNQIIC